MKLNDVVLEAASPAQQAAIAIAKKKKAGMVKEQQLDEFAPLLAAGARLFMAAAPKIAQVVGRAGQAGARGAGQAARAGTEIAAKNAGKIGMGAGAYEIGSSVADIAKDIAAKVGTAIDEKTLLDLSALAFKYAIPAGIVLAVLYGGKKAIDSLFDEPKDHQGMAEAGNNYHSNTTGFTRPKRDLSGEGEPEGMFMIIIDGRPWKEFTSNVAFQRAKTLADKNPSKKIQVRWPSGQLNTVTEGKADYNFDIEDLKRLEQIRDLSTLKAQALALISKPSAKPMKPEKVEWFKNALERMNSPLKVIKLMYDLLLSGEGNAVVGSRSSMNPNSYRQRFSEQGVAEDYNGEYDDEAGMADNNLETLQRAVEGIDDLIQSGDNLPEWCQEKIAVAKSMLVAVWDYMYSEEASDEVDPEVDEMFEAMQELVAEMAVKNRVSEDLVWEQFEAMPDHVLYETAAWRRKEGKSKKGGLNAKGVASYRRENPGSKLQMAVTTKPSKLKKGSKASKRRKSFCARMSGVKGPMKKPNGKPTRKALALRKWNC